jgi:hypothetical protein
MSATDRSRYRTREGTCIGLTRAVASFGMTSRVVIGTASVIAAIGCGPTVSSNPIGSTSMDEGTPSSSHAPSSTEASSLPEPGTTDAPPSPTTTNESTEDSSSVDSSSTAESWTESTASNSATTTVAGECEAVDILFVVDSSNSMDDVYERFTASFDGIVEGVTTAFGDASLHIGVLQTSEYWPFGPHSDCDRLGDLTITTATAECPPANGARFFTDEGDDLATALPCILDVGFYPHGEQPVTAAIEALSDDQAAPGACNEGFLRDDAVLGIFFISNDPPVDIEMDDAHPDTDTSQWYEQLLAAKEGDETAIAVTGIVAMEPVDCIEYYAAENTNLIELIDEFGSQGLRSSVCEPDWGPAFEDGIELLAQTCEQWHVRGP